MIEFKFSGELVTLYPTIIIDLCVFYVWIFNTKYCKSFSERDSYTYYMRNKKKIKQQTRWRR